MLCTKLWVCWSLLYIHMQPQLAWNFRTALSRAKPPPTSWHHSQSVSVESKKAARSSNKGWCIWAGKSTHVHMWVAEAGIAAYPHAVVAEWEDSSVWHWYSSLRRAAWPRDWPRALCYSEEKYDSWTLWARISKLSLHGQWKMFKELSEAPGERDFDRRRWVSHL